ncbi:MAG: UbiA family prenyltransferase [Acidimicrobiales bacterium]
MLRDLLRASHTEPTVTVTVIAGALAASTGRSAAGVAAVASAVLAGQLSVGWHNDWLDAPRDRQAGRGDKPLVTTSLRRGTVGTAAGAALTACVPLSLLSGWRAAAAHLAAVALAWGYNAWLKSTALSWVPYAVSFALLVSFVTLGLRSHRWPAWWALVAAALLGVGAHLANVVADLEADAGTGVRGLPHRLGAQRSAIGAAALLVAASAFVAFGPGRAGWTALGLPAAAGLVAGALALRRRAPEWLFRAAMLVALVDVAMLVSRGRHL